jgi:hypothetical protein
MATCDEMKLKAQALIDNELDEKEIPEVVNHLESCYRCRNDYITLLQLQKKLKGVSAPQPPREWFEELPGKVFRRSISLFGKILFFGSYAALFVYAMYTFFVDKGEELFFKITVGGIVVGVIVLLGVTISDRVRESRTDKYKGVMK